MEFLLKRSKYDINEIFMKGWMILIPKGMTGSDFRKRQIEREIRSLEDKIEVLQEGVSVMRNEIVELDVVIVQTEEDNEEREEKIERLLPKFWKHLDRKTKPHWDEDDTELSSWWGERGIDISYGDLIKRWEE